jgi:hypothetical protein
LEQARKMLISSAAFDDGIAGPSIVGGIVDTARSHQTKRRNQSGLNYLEMSLSDAVSVNSAAQSRRNVAKRSATEASAEKDPGQGGVPPPTRLAPGCSHSHSIARRVLEFRAVRSQKSAPILIVNVMPALSAIAGAWKQIGQQMLGPRMSQPEGFCEAWESMRRSLEAGDRLALTTLLISVAL